MKARLPLWRCPACKREFANRNQTHSCGTHDLEHHFEGKPPEIRALFDRIASLVEAIGPVQVLPEKTRIAFQVRMSFAQLTPRRRWLDGHVVLARRREHARFRSIQTLSPRNHVHVFRISSPGELDAEFRSWMKEAYAVGAQEHLVTTSNWFFFYSFDCNEPMHVHVRRDRQHCKFWLVPIELAWNHGFSPRELNEIRHLILDNEPRIIEAWHEHCDQR